MASDASVFNPVASQRGATSNGGRVVTVRVGSFNFGVDQKMLLPEPWERRHEENVRRVCEDLVDFGDLDILFG